MKYVIIGASAAGVQAADELRKLDNESTITIIGEESSPPYSRCLISRYVDGRLNAEKLYFKGAHFFEQNWITPILGERVVSINSQGQSVELTSGKSIPYDKLLIATGSRPSMPKIPGMELNGVYSFHSLSGATSIAANVHRDLSAVVLGAGFAGLEAAYALRRRGCAVTVIERCSQILPSQFDREGGDIVRKDIESLGIEIIFDQSVSSIEGVDSRVESVVLANKARILCEMVVFATGIVPNSELANNAGLTHGRGIVVDEYLRTSNPHIFAAGDVIEIDDISTGRRITSATWINAVLQGRYAAFNMVGKQRKYAEGIGIQNAVQFHRIPGISFGQTLIDPDFQDEFEVTSIHTATVYKKLIIKDNRIVGMIFVGDIAKAGFYAALIRSAIDIERYKSRLLDDDFSYAILARELQFGQYDPYRDTAACWNNDSWWIDRAKCITA